MSQSMMPLKSCESYNNYEIGGKARNLSKLIQAGLPVPNGWIVPAEEFSNHLIANDLADLAHAAFADGDVTSCGDLHKSSLNMNLQPRLLQALSNLPEVSLAVRSSASVEDGARGSYSGLFSSFLGVDTAHLQNAIKEVWASVFSLEVLSYHRQVADGAGYPAMAVLIMPMLDAQISGVAFSAVPSDGNPFRICISACRGLGTRIVDGSESGARYVLDFDTLETVTASSGHQTKGDFLQADGRVVTKIVNAEVILSEDQLHVLGRAVRAIDDVLDRRVDVEFAFTDGGLAILQAREILGLPRFFPDNPTGELCVCNHTIWYDPLPPLVRDIHTGPMEHPQIPRPPWDLENESISCEHGRAFGHFLPDKDRKILHDTEALADPTEYFQRYHTWTEQAYDSIVPGLRQSCTNLLSLSENKLAALDPIRLARLLQETFDLERQAHVFYLSCTWPTSFYPYMTAKLLQDWMAFPKGHPKVYSSPAEQLAMEMIQGVPTLLHARDAELQQIALGSEELDDFICRWGYSYIVRDEQLYMNRWKSWREDAQPLTQAIEQMQRAGDQCPLDKRLALSRKRADQALARTIEQLRALFPRQHEQQTRILTAYVQFGRAHFRMKDDRDLIWSHAQAALRWILREATRRLIAHAVIASDNDVFLFTSRELLGFFADGRPTPDEASATADQRRHEQKHLARFSLDVQDKAVSPAPSEGGVMIGIPTSSGIAEGKAHIVHEDTALADLEGLEDGDILVLIGEGKVGLTMFFPQIAGLAYSGGNGFCHEVNILRELGKPAIVSLGENAYLIEEGERLRIDAGKGTVTRLQQAE